ncbi:TetR/AcrR family transcriptional regulator [Leptospira sp. 201903074]|uniref:TetR/AcrR family transcriptional regulator n=1 Tax=Leptospira abararensis TaxID=2810036 RepID=UPI0019643179|nr:TetR/AcrR family transcriptional regulator [Leptospira abararensis]MBM9548028.1 TetR/AcrR family transcriptional regulator [Leptospira abararensis]
MNQYDEKHQLILSAATQVFLRKGYLGTNMEEIATEAAVSKQTVYKHFTSKEALFIEIITNLTTRKTEDSYNRLPLVDGVRDVRKFLVDYALGELSTLLTPEVIQLRRLVIGEAERFPDLAAVYFKNGPQVAFDKLSELFAFFCKRGLLQIVDIKKAAEDFNWMILSAYLNKAMFLGNPSLPNSKEIRKHAEHSVSIFLKFYEKVGK